MYSINTLLISFAYYLLIFILPIYFYLKFKCKVNPFTYLRLNNSPIRGITIGLIFAALYLSLLVLKNYINGWRQVNLNIGVLWIGVLFVGILEEIPFRGFLLQKLQNRTGFLTANIITTVMFIVIHYPIWVSTGTNILQTSLALSFISFILGYLFKEFDSLWLPIICHSVFNMSIWIGLK